MESIIYITFIIYAVQISIYAIVLLLDKSHKLNNTVLEAKKVAVLIACRNEEQNILSCLCSLYAQNYPKEYFEVWIGDDNSSDNTAQLVKKFIENKPNFHYVKIDTQLKHLKAKQNVLAQLAKYTNAEILLITDADILTPPTWIQTMVLPFENETTGISCGTTHTLPDGFFSTLQSIDWLFYMGIAKANLNLGLPITAVGNNMAIKRSVYEQIGGYESLSFSITEDYKLFKEILKCTKYRAVWLFSVQNTNITYSIKNLQAWLQQRKRWLKGGKELPFKVWLLMIFNVWAEICLYISLVQYIPLFGLVFMVKFLFNTFLLLVIFSKLDLWKKQWLWSIFMYPFYQMGLIPILFVYFLLPIKVQWKSRKY